MKYIDANEMLKWLNQKCNETSGEQYICFDECRDAASRFLRESNNGNSMMQY